MSSQRASARLKKIEEATITNERVIQDLQAMLKEHNKTIAEYIKDSDSKYEFLENKMDSIQKSLSK